MPKGLSPRERRAWPHGDTLSKYLRVTKPLINKWGFKEATYMGEKSLSDVAMAGRRDNQTTDSNNR